MINRLLGIEKKRNRGHLISGTGDPSQRGGPWQKGPADFESSFRSSRDELSMAGFSNNDESCEFVVCV